MPIGRLCLSKQFEVFKFFNPKPGEESCIVEVQCGVLFSANIHVHRHHLSCGLAEWLLGISSKNRFEIIFLILLEIPIDFNFLVRTFSTKEFGMGNLQNDFDKAIFLLFLIT